MGTTKLQDVEQRFADNEPSFERWEVLKDVYTRPVPGRGPWEPTDE